MDSLQSDESEDKKLVSSDDIKSAWYVRAIYLNISLTSVVHGTSFSIINVLSEHLPAYYGWSEEETNAKFILLSTLVSLGATIICLLTPYFVTRGRRLTFICYLSCLSFTYIMYISNNEILLFVGRFIQGLCLGIFGSVYGVYLKEMLPPQHYGVGMAVPELFLVVGKAASPFLAIKLGPPGDPDSVFMMKIILGFPLILLIINLLGFFFIFRERTPKFALS